QSTLHFAARLGLSQATLSRIETGKRKVTSEDAERICRLLNADHSMTKALVAAAKRESRLSSQPPRPLPRPTSLLGDR
ncbi:helix-turn-helix transcriptional regulator, partial [Frankia sp. Cas3]|uniref:helix-turn-helix domain-containing protein n=1 Tax=Frankia sp. Cas3 TaxID=3073926 RepID=UPI002AD37FB5